VAGGGRGAGAGRPHAHRPLRRRRQRRGPEAEADVNRDAGEALAGGVLRHPAAAVRREDRPDRREARPEEERGARLVLQPATEAKANEIRRRSAADPALTCVSYTRLLASSTRSMTLTHFCP